MSSTLWRIKTAVVVSKARPIVLLTEQVVLKCRAPLMAGRWKGAQKLTAEGADLLLKTKPILRFVTDV